MVSSYYGVKLVDKSLNYCRGDSETALSQLFSRDCCPLLVSETTVLTTAGPDLKLVGGGHACPSLHWPPSLMKCARVKV